MSGSLGDGATSTSTHECERIGREYKQLIQLFSDQTVFGNALLEQANNITINVDEPEAESSKSWLIFKNKFYKFVWSKLVLLEL